MKKSFFAFALVLLLIDTSIFALNSQLMTAPVRLVSAWEYTDGAPSDTLFEGFGPRADRMLVKLYSDSEATWDALEAGELDITDSELTLSRYNEFKQSPYNDTFNVVSSGSDYTFEILDINNNNNEYLGNPPDPSYPNPVYQNPCSVLGMRKAIAHLCDRNYVTNNITGPFGSPTYTPILPESVSFVHPEIRPGGAREDLCYLYSRASANASLDSSGFEEKDAEGWRIWNVTGQRVELRFYIRLLPEREAFGNFLADELEAVGIKVNRIYWPIVSIVTEDPAYHKNFHLSVGGWSFDYDPDVVALWQSVYYWHPSKCYNLAGCHDEVFDAAVDAMMNVDSPEEAIAPARLAQERFAEMVLSVPLWYDLNYRAVSRRYVGTPSTPDEEDLWEGQYWEGITETDLSNSLLYYWQAGADNPFTFTNMHPKNYARGDGSHMTIRYGLSTTSLASLNPLFAQTPYDHKILDLMYESLLKRDPYNVNSFIPWLAHTYAIDTYLHPVYGECTRINITIRPDVYWSDGTPLTAADIYFTLVEANDILVERGIYPIWCPWIDTILSFRTPDPYNFEILLSEKDVWIAGSICTTRILPRHIWEPLCRTGSPSGFAPDPNFIASGPWRLKEYVASSHIELVRNDPGSTVQTNLAGSTPIISPQGYFRALPLGASICGDHCKAKFCHRRGVIWIPPVIVNMTIDFTATLLDMAYGTNLTVDKYVFIDDVLQPGYPVMNISLASLSLHEEHFNVTYASSMHRIKIAALIKEPEAWSGRWVNATQYIWITITEDICGSTLYDDMNLPSYPYKGALPSPNLRLEIKDVARVAAAFGSYPGHSGWSPICDIHGDYKIDIKDLALISARFGWHP